MNIPVYVMNMLQKLKQKLTQKCYKKLQRNDMDKRSRCTLLFLGVKQSALHHMACYRYEVVSTLCKSESYLKLHQDLVKLFSSSLS